LDRVQAQQRRLVGCLLAQQGNFARSASVGHATYKSEQKVKKSDKATQGEQNEKIPGLV
jgi:hypothetical protein